MKNVIYGFLMGTAELLPGISGSTIALMLGIYDKFIEVINQVIALLKGLFSFLKRDKSLAELKKDIVESDIVFVISLGFGMLLSFALLSGLILHLFENYPHLIVSILLGLVIAALPIPLSEIKRNYLEISIMFVVALVLWILIGIQDATTAANITPIYLFLAGLIGISGMVLPGLSGSFILLLFGVYYYVLALIKQFFTLDIDIHWFVETFSFGIGLLVGFVTTAKILKFSLSKYRSMTMAVIAGLLLGSIRMLNPFVIGIGVGDQFYLEPVGVSYFDPEIVILIISLIAVSAIFVGWINLSRIKKGVFKVASS